MHEATIASNILNVVQARLQRHPSTRARSVTVLVGEFRNVDEEALRFAFDSLKHSIPDCSVCELIVLESRLVARCAQKNHLYEPSPDEYYRCHCGSGMGTIQKGQELEVIGCTLEAIPEEELCTK
jgi:hydrogenase nickel insertion protein HypA